MLCFLLFVIGSNGAQGVPKYTIGVVGGGDGRVGEVLVKKSQSLNAEACGCLRYISTVLACTLVPCAAHVHACVQLQCAVPATLRANYCAQPSAWPQQSSTDSPYGSAPSVAVHPDLAPAGNALWAARRHHQVREPSRKRGRLRQTAASGIELFF